jgi:hypothetical protein
VRLPRSRPIGFAPGELIQPGSPGGGHVVARPWDVEEPPDRGKVIDRWHG